ncbi:hypothetical protein [Enterovirga aerilata]|uniref:Uncharacterized protein n=1 Tax=Enterovirga aerilata TaxID=2730920 RepID=A0A849IB69_9HYPH|nr:hypothetical protein [Enterovirga sp. DB1703]NNM73280.1 hypothetical protein [Enterovirga sp. DB1703]
MAPGYYITVDTPPYGVSSVLHPSAEGAAERTGALLAEGRTVYVTTPEGDLLPGQDFLAEMSEQPSA